MSDENYSLWATFYTALVGWIIITSTWMHKKISRNEFREFRKEYREDIKGVHERLDNFIERRNEPRGR